MLIVPFIESGKRIWLALIAPPHSSEITADETVLIELVKREDIDIQSETQQERNTQEDKRKIASARDEVPVVVVSYQVVRGAKE